MGEGDDHRREIRKGGGGLLDGASKILDFGELIVFIMIVWEEDLFTLF